MNDKKFLTIIIVLYLISLSAIILIVQPDLNNVIDITLELTFFFQPIIWIYLTKRYLKGQIYSKFLSLGFVFFFLGGVFEILDEKFPNNFYLGNIERLTMVIAIAFITYAIIHMTKLTNIKLSVLSKNNKRHYIESIHDPLTSLYNKRYLQTNFNMIFNNNPAIFHNCVCVFIDIDNFKIFNDTQGHESGDVLLEEFGTLIKESKRKGDFAFRYGGEEFLIFFMNTHPALIYEKIEDIRKKFRAYTKENFYHPEVSFTLSIGTTTYQYGEDLTSIINRADQAMYFSKHAGKDRITSA